MSKENITAERLIAFSDAVFAVIVTIMVLELKAPDDASFSDLVPLWPTAISYVVSYLFIAIIWINHHHLMRFVGPPTLGLIWINFVHLFMVSLLPFATAWIARTRLASSPVVFYAGLFVAIDIAYNVFEHHVLAQADALQVPARMRRIARRPIPNRPCEPHGRDAGCLVAAPRQAETLSSFTELNPYGRWTVSIATSTTKAVGMLTQATKAPSNKAKPPRSSVPMVNDAATCGSGTLSCCKIPANASGPLDNFAKPCSMKPYPTRRRIGTMAQRARSDRCI
jgi:uncharacterized membrane protein